MVAAPMNENFFSRVHATLEPAVSVGPSLRDLFKKLTQVIQGT